MLSAPESSNISEPEVNDGASFKEPEDTAGRRRRKSDKRSRLLTKRQQEQVENYCQEKECTNKGKFRHLSTKSTNFCSKECLVKALAARDSNGEDLVVCQALDCRNEGILQFARMKSVHFCSQECLEKTFNQRDDQQATDSGPAVQENTIPATNTSGGNYLHQLHNLPFDFVASAAPTQFPRPDDTGSMGALSSNIFTTIGSSGAMNLLASASAASAPASVPTMSGRHGHGQGMDMGFSAESTMRGPGPSTSSHSFPSSSSGGATINGGAPSFHGAGTASSSVDTSSSPRKKKTGEKRKSYVQDIVFFTEEMDQVIRNAGVSDWRSVAHQLGNRVTPKMVANRWKYYLDPALKKRKTGDWTSDEVQQLHSLVREHSRPPKHDNGSGAQIAVDWDAVGLALNRTYKDVQDKWKIITRAAKTSTLKKGQFSRQEEEIILRRAAEWMAAGKSRGLWPALEKELGRSAANIRNKYIGVLVAPSAVATAGTGRVGGTTSFAGVGSTSAAVAAGGNTTAAFGGSTAGGGGTTAADGTTTAGSTTTAAAGTTAAGGTTTAFYAPTPSFPAATYSMSAASGSVPTSTFGGAPGAY